MLVKAHNQRRSEKKSGWYLSQAVWRAVVTCITSTTYSMIFWS